MLRRWEKAALFLLAAVLLAAMLLLGRRGPGRNEAPAGALLVRREREELACVRI